MAKPKTKHNFDENIESELAKRIVSGEYITSQINRQADNRDFEAYIALLDSEREEKNYDWQSDISIPEFPSHILTQTSIDVNQYFQTRDFVETYVEDEGQESLDAAAATKELINRTLNQKHLYHYQKFVRGKVLNNLSGYVYAECWWEQKTKREVIGVTHKTIELDVDTYGNKITDPSIQIPATEIEEEPVYGDIPVIDRFNYEILDPRNVFTDNRYTYSLQEKDWVITRKEQSLSKLKADQSKAGYFNLHLLEEMSGEPDTQTSKETDNKENTQNRTDYAGEKYFDILKRYGRSWAIVKERDENDTPIKAEPGIDQFGTIKPKAEFIEMVIIFAVSAGHSTLIAYHPTPNVSSEGVPFKPVIRGLCYIHPTKDNGIGDGKYSREIQIGIDDTFNISQDRVMLATLPTLKGKRDVTEDNNTIFFEPEHVIELEDPEKDLQEFTISDDIQGALSQIGILTNKMQQVNSIFPTTMGDLPGKASTTATAVAGAEGSTNIRTNYKSLTFEFTFLTELYWMIQQMTWAFATEQTAVKLMGEKVYSFNPVLNYTYKPLSQSIETEQSKGMKLKTWTQALGYVMQIQHPDSAKMVNYILLEMFKLMGDEPTNFANIFLNPDIPIQQKGGQGEEQAGEQSGMGGGMSNQNQVPMSGMETQTREGAGGGYY